MLPSEVKESEKRKGGSDIKVFPWTHEQELLLAEWAEKSMCYRWLHGRSEKSYRFKNDKKDGRIVLLKNIGEPLIINCDDNDILSVFSKIISDSNESD